MQRAVEDRKSPEVSFASRKTHHRLCTYREYAFVLQTIVSFVLRKYFITCLFANTIKETITKLFYFYLIILFLNIKQIDVYL